MRNPKRFIERILGLFVIALILFPSMSVPVKDCFAYCYDWDCVTTDSYTWRNIYIVHQYNLFGNCVVNCADKFKPNSTARIAVVDDCVFAGENSHDHRKLEDVPGKRRFYWWNGLQCNLSNESDAVWHACRVLVLYTC